MMQKARRPFGKSLVICIDGTTNAPEIGPGSPSPTNVLLFSRALRTQDARDAPQIVNYIWGVGTDESAGSTGRTYASGTGRGLSVLVQKAYEFLVNNYDRRDYVYILGFSRGAAAARSLSGLTELFGILPKTAMDKFPDAWEYYNQKPLHRDIQMLGRRSPTLATIARQGEAFRQAHERECLEAGGDPIPSEFFQHFEPRGDETESRAFRPEFGNDAQYVPLPLHFVGVWDTVLTAFGEGFHEQRLAWNVGTACHALAIHEVRRPFRPVLWTRACRHQEVVQTWFPGAHSDIGGGNGNIGLSSIPLLWMVQHAQTYPYHPAGHSLEFDGAYLNAVTKPNICADVSNPEGEHVWMRKATRSIGGTGAIWRTRQLQFRSPVVDQRMKGGAPPYVVGYGAERMKKEADRRSSLLPLES